MIIQGEKEVIRMTENISLLLEAGYIPEMTDDEGGVVWHWSSDSLINYHNHPDCLGDWKELLGSEGDEVIIYHHHTSWSSIT